MATDYGSAAGVYWAGPPRSYTTGRDTPVRLSVVHTTEGHANATAAEDGIAYDKTRTDGTSCHVFHDSDSSPQEVLRKDTSHSAYYHGNTLGIHHELCGFASWTPAQWNGSYQQAMLRRCAMAVADDCKTYGLEPRRLSVAEVRRAYYGPEPRPKGICGHVDITQAFPEDDGSHYDPGTSFPWAQFIDLVQQYMSGSSLVGGDTDMISYQFATNFPGLPADLGNRIINTDRMGIYDVEPFSTPRVGSPAVTQITSAMLPSGWDFGKIFGALTGGCSYSADGTQQVADWRKATATVELTEEQIQQIVDGVVAGLPDLPDDLIAGIVQACKTAITGAFITPTP